MSGRAIQGNSWFVAGIWSSATRTVQNSELNVPLLSGQLHGGIIMISSTPNPLYPDRNKQLESNSLYTMVVFQYYIQ